MNKKFISDFLEETIPKNNKKSEVQELIKLFPYCETIRKIDLIIKYQNEDITFEDTIPKVAIYSSNRKSLFLFLLKASNPILFNQTWDKKKTSHKNTKQSFYDWLTMSSLNKIKTPEKAKKILINSKESTDDLMTETLAKLYLEQGHFDQAIRAYEILRLKYPKKSSLFATEISKITKLKLKNE